MMLSNADSPRSRGWTLAALAPPATFRGFPALAGMDLPGTSLGFVAQGIPRARGDGPMTRPVWQGSKRDSPRSRGWTWPFSARMVHRQGFPALAGMDPRGCGGRPRRSRIPRARGDGPSVRSNSTLTPPDSPRSRGWTCARLQVPAHGVGFPALAGMDPGGAVPNDAAAGIPRARGDGPSPSRTRRASSLDSPRSRGWTLKAGRYRFDPTGFPALAGMDPRGCAAEREEDRIPRARGDGPRLSAPLRPSREDSPRSRGWTLVPRGVEAGVIGFPALAGMDPAGPPARRAARRIPRARGDGPRAPRPPAGRPGDSPRSRGWTAPNAAPTGPNRGFPALAGMDPGDGASMTSANGIPRARGDGPVVNKRTRQRNRDSPRSRGWTPGFRPTSSRTSGFPALAGMDPGETVWGAGGARIPRARGDGPGRCAAPGCGRPDSPCSRGWTQLVDVLRRPAPGFPALAGMDPLSTSARWRRARIPRARGDGPWFFDSTQPRPADSPRSRGWTRDLHYRGVLQQGFPALAGMDPRRSRPRSRPRGIPRARGDGPS